MTNLQKNIGEYDRIIQRCIDRHENPILTPVQTIKTCGQYCVLYARNRTCNPADFKNVDIGIMPSGYYKRTDGKPELNPNCPELYGQDSSKNWDTCYGVGDWKPQSWLKSYGIQIYTGKPSLDLTDIDIEYECIRDHPERIAVFLSRLCKLTPTPFIVISKSGGLRFSCHTPGYTHPKANQHREYIATWISHNQRKDLYLEIFGEKGLSRYDARYEVVEGSIFEIPTIDHTALFEIINDLRDQIGEPRPETPTEKRKGTGNHTKASQPPKTTQTIDLENYNIDVNSLTFTNNRSRVYPTALCPATDHKNKQVHAVQFYKHDNGAVNGYCHNCSSHWWIVPPTPSRTKPIRLKNIKRFRGVIETLDKARTFLRDVFNGKSLLFAIRTDTGTGKTENAITYAMTRHVLMPVQNSNLRDEIVTRATEKFEIFAFGYRGLETKSEGDYLGCIQPERAKMFRNKGFDMYSEICPKCPAYSDCQERGYLSQKETASLSQLVAIPFPTVFLDPGLREFADTYMPRGENALVIHDDLPMGSMFIECQLQTSRLRRIMEDWNSTPAAEWVGAVIDAIGRRDWDRLSRDVLFASENQDYRISICNALTRARDASGNIYTPEDYIKNAKVDYSTAETCRKLPHLERDDWNVFIQLEMFFERYHRPNDMPIHVSNTEKTDGETLTFYLPPIPYHAKKTLRIGFMSATLIKYLIGRVLPGVKFFDAVTTEWEQGARVFQLRTNKNPRGTVLNLEKTEDQPVLSRTGEFYYQCVLDCIKAHPHEKHAVITYKSVREEKKEALEAMGVVTAHFGNLAGLDKLFEDVTRFHVLFSPEVTPDGITFLAKKIFGDDEVPLDDKRDAEGFYLDERFRLCQEALVISELLQIVGRARLNLYPNVVYLWTSRFINSITNRTETQLFDEVDWQHSNGGNIELLEKAIKLRKKREKAAETAETAGDTKALAKAKVISERHARRTTKSVRDTMNAELATRALEMKVQGLPFRKIADTLEISLGKLQNLLKDS